MWVEDKLDNWITRKSYSAIFLSASYYHVKAHLIILGFVLSLSWIKSIYRASFERLHVFIERNGEGKWSYTQVGQLQSD